MMTRFAICALTFCLTMPAAAQQGVAPASQRPTLKAEATVASDLVRIGDLIENAGAVADVAIFRAPDLGQTGNVPTARIVEAIRPHRLTQIETGGLQEVTVTRASRVVSLRQIEARIAALAAQQSGAADASAVTVTFDGEAQPIYIDPLSAGELKVLRASFGAGGRFDVTFDIPGAAAGRRAPLRYAGTAIETIAFASVNRAIARGDVIRPGDVVIERKPKAQVGADAIETLEQVAGFAARRSLRPGQPLRAADLMKPEIVRQNETVTIVFEVPGLVLSVRGKAIDAGAEGDTVNVLNVQSKRTVQGTVTGPGRVVVRSLAPRLVAADAASRTASLSAKPTAAE